jgi:two-component system chemotaxis response regulator CheY
MNILVVDDEPALRQLVRRFLDRDFNVTIIEADDGLTALDRLLKEPIDLVLLDVNMKVMGGIETLEAIRHSQTFARLPVVLMTAQADEELLRRAVELNIDGCIVKPFTPNTLRDRLSTIIGNRQSAAREKPQTARSFEIDPSSRALIVDQSPEFRVIVSRLLGRLCAVEEAENEFMAMKRCLGGSIDLLFIGETSELSTAAGLARKVRATPELRRVRVAAAVLPEERETLKALGIFDAVLARSFIEETFDASLCQALGQDSLARLLFHPTSSSVAELFALIGRGLTRWLGQGITMQEVPQHPPGESRWVLVAVEVQARRKAWDLRLRCPLPVAMEMANARHPDQTGKTTEAQASAVVGKIVEEFAEEFRPMLLERGLAGRWFPARVTVVGAAGLASAKMKSGGMRRWYVTPRQQVVPVEVVPLHKADEEPEEPAHAAPAAQATGSFNGR